MSMCTLQDVKRDCTLYILVYWWGLGVQSYTHLGSDCTVTGLFMFIFS